MLGVRVTGVGVLMQVVSLFDAEANQIIATAQADAELLIILYVLSIVGIYAGLFRRCVQLAHHRSKLGRAFATRYALTVPGLRLNSEAGAVPHDDARLA